MTLTDPIPAIMTVINMGTDRLIISMMVMIIHIATAMINITTTIVIEEVIATAIAIAGITKNQNIKLKNIMLVYLHLNQEKTIVIPTPTALTNMINTVFMGTGLEITNTIN